MIIEDESYKLAPKRIVMYRNENKANLTLATQLRQQIRYALKTFVRYPWFPRKVETVKDSSRYISRESDTAKD